MELSFPGHQSTIGSTASIGRHRKKAIVYTNWSTHRLCKSKSKSVKLGMKGSSRERYIFQRLPAHYSNKGLATRSISFLPFGRSQGSSLIDHLRQRELTTAQDLNFIILPIFRKKSIMNPATLWSDSQADTFVRSFSTNFTAGTGMLSIWVMKTMHAGIFLAKWWTGSSGFRSSSEFPASYPR